MLVVSKSFREPSLSHLDHLQCTASKIALIIVILIRKKGESAWRCEHRRFYGPDLKVAPITSLLISLMIDGTSKCVGDDRKRIWSRGEGEWRVYIEISWVWCACRPYRWNCIIDRWLYKPGLHEGRSELEIEMESHPLLSDLFLGNFCLKVLPGTHLETLPLFCCPLFNHVTC